MNRTAAEQKAELIKYRKPKLVKVSIIIPVYNVEEYLRQALDSVIHQTLKDIEIICVDDRSTDNSFEILKEYASKDGRIKILQTDKNSGPGVARNLGLNLANGEYIMFLDPDDWYELNACELAYNQIKQNDNDYVQFNYKLYREDNNTTKVKSRRLRPFLKFKDKQDIRLGNDLKNKYIVSCYTVMQIYSLKFLNKYNIRFLDIRNGEDVPFYIKVLMCSDTMSVIFDALYTYRIRENSLSRICINNSKDIFKGRYLAYDYTLKYGKGSLRRAFLIYIINNLFYWYYKQTDFKNKLVFYREMRKFFKKLNKNHNIEKIKRFIDYDEFQKVLKNNCLRLIISEIINKPAPVKDIEL